MVIIKELEIKNCLSLSHVVLRFESDKYATIFNCPSAYKLKSKLLHAIKPFFCKNVVPLPAKDKPDPERGTSHIRIKFLIPKEKGAGNDVVEAMRLSLQPTHMYYYFNDEQYIDPIHVFHERCQVDVSPFYTFHFGIESNNLLHNWISRECSLRRAIGQTFEHLANYLECPNSGTQSEQLRVVKLAQTNILISRELELSKRRTFVNIANEIGKIFTFLTFQEYSVHFYIPLCGRIVNVHDMKWEDMDLKRVETCVKKTGQPDSFLWTGLEPGLKNLLKISRMIAFAKHLKQKFIFIEDTTLLQEYQSQEMIKESMIEADKDQHADWNKKNFIKQIVDICKEMQIMIFINYHGALPLPPDNANIIKCGDFNETDGKSIHVCSNLESQTLTDFIQVFSPCFGEI